MANLTPGNFEYECIHCGVEWNGEHPPDCDRRPGSSCVSRAIPLCYRCNHKVTSHEVDDEARGACMECDCPRWENAPDGRPTLPARLPAPVTDLLSFTASASQAGQMHGQCAPLLKLFLSDALFTGAFMTRRSKDDYTIIDNRDPSRQRMIPLRERFPRLASQEETSRKAAMDLFCCQCIGGELSEIAKCTAPACPLYAWRPTSFESGREPTPERKAALAARLAHNVGRKPTGQPSGGGETG